MLVIYCFCLAIFCGELTFSVLFKKGKKVQVSGNSWIYVACILFNVKIQENGQDVWNQWKRNQNHDTQKIECVVWIVFLIPVVVLRWRWIDAWDVGVFSRVQKGQRSQCCIWNLKDLITLSVGVFPLRSTNPEILSSTSTLPFSNPIYLPLWSTNSAILFSVSMSHDNVGW